MAEEHKQDSPPPNSSHLADNPHPRSPLERMLRSVLRLHRADVHFSQAGDELLAARTKAEAASAALPAMAAQCAGRGMACAKSGDDSSQPSLIHPTQGEPCADGAAEPGRRGA